MDLLLLAACASPRLVATLAAIWVVPLVLARGARGRCRRRSPDGPVAEGRLPATPAPAASSSEQRSYASSPRNARAAASASASASSPSSRPRRRRRRAPTARATALGSTAHSSPVSGSTSKNVTESIS